MTEPNSGMNIVGAVLEGNKFNNIATFIFYDDNGTAIGLRFDRTRSNFGMRPELTGAAAYNALTIYGYNDMVDDGLGAVWLYINKYNTSGNAPPNSTFWFKIYDIITQELTIPAELCYMGEILSNALGGVATISAVVPSLAEASLNFEFTMRAAGISNTVLLCEKNGGAILTTAVDLVAQSDGFIQGINGLVFWDVTKGASANYEKNRLLYV
jgi:hypothetical protein